VIVTAMLGAGAFAKDKKDKDKDKPAQEQGISREQADAILKELREIRLLLEKQQHAPADSGSSKVKLKIDGGYYLGSKDAPLTMVEFTDYQCSFCRQFHMSTFPELRKKYIDTGKVRFLSRDLPLDFHQNAPKAAEAARCAGDQGQFWGMRELLITNAAKLSPDDINGYAQGLKLDMKAFKSCLDSEKYKDSVRNELVEAASLKVEGTPTFLIGKTTPEGVEGEFIMGAIPLAAFEAKLDELGVK
jgi:protein-disulfide isomerase